MKIQKLNLSTNTYSDADFLNKARYVLESMTDKPAFPNPVPPLSAFASAIDAYSTSLLGAAGGTHALVAVKNENRAALETLYVQLGMYVMYIAAGNTAVLASSGFTLAKEREPVYITNPGNVTLVNGVTSGELESSVANVKGSKLYLHQISDSEPAENTVWDTRTCSRSKYTFKGLTPGKKYWVRIAATASGEQIAYSTVGSQYVL
ncbi:MAG: fibronectin type III domain-containing protein [Bacteroidota bacterium]|nr:fibronectin type III domain-containing protein [Bacteroidota bacterium]